MHYQARTHTLPAAILYRPLVTKSAFVLELPNKWVLVSNVSAAYWNGIVCLCLCVCVCVCVCVFVCAQPSFVVTQVLQSVASERDEVSSTNQKCPSVVLHLSFWSAQQPDFVKVMVLGVAHSPAVSVSLIFNVHSTTRQNRDTEQMKNIIQTCLGVLPLALLVMEFLLVS